MVGKRKASLPFFIAGMMERKLARIPVREGEPQVVWVVEAGKYRLLPIGVREN